MPALPCSYKLLCFADNHCDDSVLRVFFRVDEVGEEVKRGGGRDITTDGKKWFFGKDVKRGRVILLYGRVRVHPDRKSVV